MNRKIIIAALIFVSLAGCRSNNEAQGKDSLNHASVTKFTSKGTEIPASIKEFKQMLAGFWLNKDYIDEIDRTKSTQKAYENAGPITDFTIDTSKIKDDSLVVQYNSDFHEVLKLTIKFRTGNSKNTIVANDPADYIERKFYDLKLNATGKLLTIYAYDRQKKLVDSTHFFKPNTPYDETDLDKFVINKILIAGNYIGVDSLKNTFKVNFTNEGKVEGLGDYKSYDIATDFMTPPNNVDEIYLNAGKDEKSFGFKIKADTLNIYETKDAPDSVDLVLSSLKYKLVKQH